MGRDSVKTLDKLVSVLSENENRLTDLLKDQQSNDSPDWFMCVPSCFNDALDIKMTSRVENGKTVSMWTQGSAFSFKVGDSLYDTSNAYKEWSEALKHIKICVQVVKAKSAGYSNASKKREPGEVTFAILTPNIKRTQVVVCGEHTMTQDDFVRFLISGPKSDLKEKIMKT